MGPRDQHLPLSPWLCSTTLPCLIPQTCPTCPHLSIFLLAGPSAQTASLARCWCVALFSLLKPQLEYSLFRPHRTSIPAPPPPPQQSLSAPSTDFNFYTVCTTSHCAIFMFVLECIVGHPLISFCEVGTGSVLLVLCACSSVWYIVGAHSISFK